MSTPWHTLSITDTAARLDTHLDDGLDSATAAARLAQHGPNRLPEAPRRSRAALLLGQFKDALILVLIGAALISGIVGDVVDTIAILTIVLFNAAIGAVQEYRAERALAALKRLAVPQVKVKRDGSVVELPAEQLVPGDLMLIEAGNLLAADVRLVDVASLQVDEAALTGESTVVAKQSAALDDPEQPLAERSNMAFRGTQVTYGRGQGVVVATAMATELGRIAELLTGGQRPRTPLQQRLARFSRGLAAAVLGICALIFVAGWLRGEPLLLMFMTAVSLAVAAVPEALPAVITISLALGARKLVRQRALIRQLPAVETLGSVTVICSDKTGTLTENRMLAEAFLLGDRLYRATDVPAGPLSEALWEALALNNDAERNADDSISGEPTEVALLQAVVQQGLDPQALRAARARIDELPFDADRKMMTTLHATAEGLRSYTKGAPEPVLARCTARLDADHQVQPLDAAAAAAQAEELAAAGYRVLAVALRDWREPPAELDSPTLEAELRLIGLVALLDPPRPEAADAVATCRSAGITPVMITGDHPVTARAIAERLGIAEHGDEVLTGSELADLSDQALAERCAHVRLYARVAPEQKIRIVAALQDRGEFVAMTGDGVNDAPALRRANIGVAMGKGGTDVAREAAHMVLLDDNFATIVAAVREGRRIFDNIRKFIKDTMSSNSGEIWTLFLAPFLGLPVPLLPIHILWINLVTDGLPGLAFTAEPAEPGLMRRKPRPPDESIFAHGMWQHILWVGLFVGALSIAVQAWAYGRGAAYWQTMVFTVLTISQLFHSLAVRTEQTSLLRIGLFSNLPMLGAVLLAVTLQLAVVYVPACNAVFKTQPLPLPELVSCFALASLVLPAVELEKWLVRRGWLYGEAPVRAT